MLLAQILLPLAFGVLAFLIRSNQKRPWLLPIGGGLHLIGTCAVLLGKAPALEDAWLGLDPLNKVVLGFLSLLFFLCSVYARGYLAMRPDRPNRIFTTSLFAFLAMLTLAVEAQHLGLMWVAIEACTLSSAPLLYFNQNPRSLEATWKYLLIGSVGIA
ncbi:MAG TPA: hydrogenase, partial [Polyangia bacterium]